MSPLSTHQETEAEEKLSDSSKATQVLMVRKSGGIPESMA